MLCEKVRILLLMAKTLFKLVSSSVFPAVPMFLMLDVIDRAGQEEGTYQRQRVTGFTYGASPRFAW